MNKHSEQDKDQHKPSNSIEKLQQKTDSPKAKSNSAVKEPSPSVVAKEPKQQGSSGIILAIIAIILVLLLAGASYYFYLQLDKKLSSNVTNSDTIVTQQSGAHQKIRQEMSSNLERSQQKINQLSQQLTASNQTFELLEAKLLEVSGRRPSDWLLAEANYLVKLAGRKLWQEKNKTTAIALLKTADLRIAEMNEPALVTLRKALAQDIAALKALPQDQTESIALRLDGLISQVDNLKLNMVELPDMEKEQDDGVLSESPSDWEANLVKTWHSFIDGFITVRRRSAAVEPLMSPKQQWYLEENLKSKLIQSQLALYRHQQAAFEHSIELASRWIMQFYDRNDSTTEFMLEEFSTLQALNITIEYPANFDSSILLYNELKRRSIDTTNVEED